MSMDDTNSVKNAIKKAMLQNMSPQQQAAMLNAQGPVPGPGEIGNEGAVDPNAPPPMSPDQMAQFDQTAQAADAPPVPGAGPNVQQMAPNGQGMPKAPPPPAPPGPPVPPPASALERFGSYVVPTEGPDEGNMSAFNNDMDQMSMMANDNRAQNIAMMKRLGVTPQQMQQVMAQQGQGAAPPEAGVNPIAKALMALGFSGR